MLSGTARGGPGCPGLDGVERALAGIAVCRLPPALYALVSECLKARARMAEAKRAFGTECVHRVLAGSAQVVLGRRGRGLATHLSVVDVRVHALVGPVVCRPLGGLLEHLLALGPAGSGTGEATGMVREEGRKGSRQGTGARAGDVGAWACFNNNFCPVGAKYCLSLGVKAGVGAEPLMGQGGGPPWQPSGQRPRSKACARARNAVWAREADPLTRSPGEATPQSRDSGCQSLMHLGWLADHKVVLQVVQTGHATKGGPPARTVHRRDYHCNDSALPGRTSIPTPHSKVDMTVCSGPGLRTEGNPNAIWLSTPNTALLSARPPANPSGCATTAGSLPLHRPHVVTR